MATPNNQDVTDRPAGYLWLANQYGLKVVPHWRRSLVSTRSTRKTTVRGGMTEEIYPKSYWPGDTPGDHLEFALKYDGVNLAQLAALFRVMDPAGLTAYIRSKPTGRYARRAWFFYEFLTEKPLPLDDLTRGSYVDLLNPDQYVTARPKRAPRQRVNVNLLGTREFCPVVRRGNTPHNDRERKLQSKLNDTLAGYSPDMLKRAMSYAYTKETKSSFAIEGLKPEAGRTERFIAMLRAAEKESFVTKPALIDAQNRIVDERYRNRDYRTEQSYVGESVIPGREIVHYVCPQPGDLDTLMRGLLDAHLEMAEAELPAVVHAAAIAYGFVFMHPFDDGNGRIHRFLIHNILATRGFTPSGVMFPVSAAMLNNAGDYDASLEAFSAPLLQVLDYDLDDEGRMTVSGDTRLWYAYPDLTPQVEALYAFIGTTIETELVSELVFLESYDKTKSKIQDIVDMPDRSIDLLIRLCLQNKLSLSRRKRERHFPELTDDEVAALEEVIREHFTDIQKG